MFDLQMGQLPHYKKVNGPKSNGRLAKMERLQITGPNLRDNGVLATSHSYKLHIKKYCYKSEGLFASGINKNNYHYL